MGGTAARGRSMTEVLSCARELCHLITVMSLIWDLLKWKLLQVNHQNQNQLTRKAGCLWSLHRKLARELSEVLFDAPSRLTESRDQSERHLEFPMAPLRTWTCWSGTYRQCLSAAPACISQLGPIPTRPCIGHL